mgnify:CR=1 FL=1
MLFSTPTFHRLAAIILFVAVATVAAYPRQAAAQCCCGPKTLFSWNGCCGCCEDLSDDGDSEDGDVDYELDLDEPLLTDRPDFTEASSTVGLGVVQLEMGYTFTEDTQAGVSTRSHSGPQALWRIGMFREWFELRIGQTLIEESVTVGGVRTTSSGFDDLYIGAKIALTEQCCCLPEMAIIPQATVPTGDRAFTTNQFMPGINWVYSWELNDCVAVAGSTQGNRARDDTGQYYTEFAQSATVALGLTDRLGAYSEWFAFFPHGANDPGTRPEHYFNGGFTYLLTNDIQLDIEAGVGLNDHADDFFVATGVAMRR